jgi:hypothetical protein
MNQISLFSFFLLAYYIYKNIIIILLNIFIEIFFYLFILINRN